MKMGRLLTSPPVANRWAALRHRYLGRPQRKKRLFRSESLLKHDLLRGFRGGLGITSQRIWLSDLPEGFRGFRILQLSDIHHSLFVPLDQVAAASGFSVVRSADKLNRYDHLVPRK